MASNSLPSKSIARPAHLEALLNPLGSIVVWTTSVAARDALELLAHSALEQRNHSLWWNYIYLHDRYVQQFSPTDNERLPGFPDMDTSVKVGAPSVNNWYYLHKKIPVWPKSWSDVDFCDFSLGVRSGAVPIEDACDMLLARINTWSFGNFPDVRQKKSAPFWLLAEAWHATPVWSSLMRALNDPFSNAQSAGISSLDRQVVAPALIWQWNCLNQRDISFLPQEPASKSLDALRLGNIGDILRAQCESHFLTYFPQCKREAAIAFSLGAPLWIPVADTLSGELLGDVFEPSPEALHPK